jgi:hypothetical protein
MGVKGSCSKGICIWFKCARSYYDWGQLSLSRNKTILWSNERNRDSNRVHIDDYSALSTDERMVRIVVSRQPIAASIRVGVDFKKYGGGIYKAACGDVRRACGINSGIRWKKILDHKEFWGENWRLAGYFFMIRKGQNDDPKAGHCGLLIKFVYSILLAD